MRTRLEKNKKPGVSYALTADGIELPIVDVTHPAFALTLTEADLAERLARFLAEPPPLAKLPAPLRRPLLRLLLRGSCWRAGSPARTAAS